MEGGAGRHVADLIFASVFYKSKNTKMIFYNKYVKEYFCSKKYWTDILYRMYVFTSTNVLKFIALFL